MIFFIFIFGLVAGSFLTAFTYRFRVGESVVKGRSKCDDCGALISWYDNIPILSYIFLSGKCRNCGKKISIRYPLIEFSTAVIFTLAYMKINSGNIYSSNADFIQLTPLFYYLFLITILIAIFVIDLENQIIPDELVFILVFVQILYTLIAGGDKIFEFLFSGFAAAGFILSINLITFGKGMGLGDAKLALFPGIFFGIPMTIVWAFSSFIIGAAVGVVLIFLKKADFGKRIAFGPFMVIAFFVTWFWGGYLVNLLLPFY